MMFRHDRLSTLVVASLLLLLVSPGSTFAWFTDGSATFRVNQRFFKDDRFVSGTGSTYQFNTWPTLDLEFVGGITEPIRGLEPIFGVSYVQKRSRGLPGIPDVNGQVSSDKFRYEFLTLSLGLRYKLWEPHQFILIPVVEALMSYRFGRFKKFPPSTTAGEKNSITGYDFGAILGGGLLLSFLWDQERKSDLSMNWGVKDFGLLTTLRYLPAGWGKSGLGSFRSSGGWDFGAGLLVDW